MAFTFGYTQAEDHLRASGIACTIIRPGGLPPGEPTGSGLLSEDKTALGWINRKDLATLIVGALDDDRTIGKTFAAIDPTRSGAFDEFGIRVTAEGCTENCEPPPPPTIPEPTTMLLFGTGLAGAFIRKRIKS